MNSSEPALAKKPLGVVASSASPRVLIAVAVPPSSSLRLLLRSAFVSSIAAATTVPCASADPLHSSRETIVHSCRASRPRRPRSHRHSHRIRMHCAIE